MFLRVFWNSNWNICAFQKALSNFIVPSEILRWTRLSKRDWGRSWYVQKVRRTIQTIEKFLYSRICKKDRLHFDSLTMKYFFWADSQFNWTNLLKENTKGKEGRDSLSPQFRACSGWAPVSVAQVRNMFPKAGELSP